MKNSQFGNKIGYFWNSTEYILGRVDIKIEILDLLGKLVEIEKNAFYISEQAILVILDFGSKSNQLVMKLSIEEQKTFLRLVTTCYLQGISHDSSKKSLFNFQICSTFLSFRQRYDFQLKMIK